MVHPHLMVQEPRATDPLVRDDSVGARLTARSSGLTRPAMGCGSRERKVRPLGGRTSASTHPMRPQPGDLTIIITPEPAAFKARHPFDALRDFARLAAGDG